MQNKERKGGIKMLNKILYSISMVEVLVLIVLGGFIFENVQLFLYELLMLSLTMTVTMTYANFKYGN